MRSDHEYSLERPATGPRLAAFGDSFAHCDDVENDECWTAQMEEATPGLEAVKVVALTANVMRGDREKTLAAGCDGYIQKPIDVDQLPRQIARFLDH